VALFIASITGLSAGWLVGAGVAASAPLLAHLIRTRPRRVVTLPTARFIASIERETARGRRVRELLLLACRAIALLLLGLAFATPAWTSHTDADPGAERTVYVLDASASMRRAEGGRSLFERARRHVSHDIADNPGREAAVVVARRSPVAILPRLTTNSDVLLGELGSVAPSYEYASLKEAVALAASLPDEASRVSARRVVIVTDAARTGFEGLSAGEFASVEIVRIGSDGPPRNTGVHSVSLSPARPVANGEISLGFTLANHTDEPRTLPVILRIGDRVRTEFFEIAEQADAEIEFPLAGLPAGEHTIEIELPADALPADDSARIVANVARTHSVGVFTRASSPLRAPFLAAVGSSVPVEIDALEHMSAIVVADPGPLPDSALASIAEFARSGGAVLWCISDAESAELLLRMPAPAQSDTLFDGIEMSENTEGSQGLLVSQPGQIFGTPLSDLFERALEELRFTGCARIASASAWDVALRFQAGELALARLAYADGSLSVLALDVRAESSAILRSPVFPLLMDAIIGSPGRGTIRRAAIIGERDRLSSGSRSTPGIAGSNGQPGTARAWNIDGRESDPSRIDPRTLIAQNPDENRDIPASANLARVERERQLWPWLALASALAFACESLLLARARAPYEHSSGGDALAGTPESGVAA